MIAAALDIQRCQIEAALTRLTEEKIAHRIDNVSVHLLRSLLGQAP